MFTLQCQCTTATTTKTTTATANSLGDRSAYDSAVEDSYCDGYQADTEDQWASGDLASRTSSTHASRRNNNNKPKKSDRSSHCCEHSEAFLPTSIGSLNWQRWQVPSVSAKNLAEKPQLPLSEQIDLCRAALIRAATLATEDIEGCKSSESSLAIINSLTRSCRENGDNSRILFENDFTSLLIDSFKEFLSVDHQNKALKLAVFDLLEELCKVQVRSTELRMLLDLFKADTATVADLDFLLSTTNKILFSKWQQQSEANQPQYSVRYPVQAKAINNHNRSTDSTIEASLPINNRQAPTKKLLWLDTIMGNIRSYGTDSRSGTLGASAARPAAASSDHFQRQQHQMAFKTAAVALPFHSAHITNFYYSFVLWIYLDKISPLVDKSRAFSSSGGGGGTSSINSKSSQLLPPPKVFSSHNFELGSMTESAAAAAQSSASQCTIHITSLNFNSSTVELWFDYVYNRFVYRICKENGGRLIYFNENFVANSSANLGRWNFLRVNVEQIVVAKARNSFLKIAHSTNCSKDETIKLSYPLNLLEKGAANAALLLGATTTATVSSSSTLESASSAANLSYNSVSISSNSSFSSSSSFSYRLGNLLLFNQHLQPPSTVYLYSLGADWSHPHHLRSEWVAKENYFTLPKTLLSSKYGGGGVDSISALHSCIAPSFESKLLLRHLILLYSAASSTVYFSSYHPQRQNLQNQQQSDGVASKLQSKLSFSRFYPTSISSTSSKSKSKQQLQQNLAAQMREHKAVLYCAGGNGSESALKVEQNVGISKTIADTGGISVFLFLLCYVFERSESGSEGSGGVSSKAAVQQKAMELLLRAYESHYQHRLHFDAHLAGHRMLLYVLQRSCCASSGGASYSPTMLRLFAQFSIDASSGVSHSVVLSQTALEVFLSSWRVWSGNTENSATLNLFFSRLEALVNATNPYRNYNLAQLRRVNAFSRLLCMIKDMYSDFESDDFEHQGKNKHQHNYHLDGDSLAHVIALFNAIIDSSSDLALFKAVFNCLLLLQRTELLHINQTRASFYFLCLPTWSSSSQRSREETGVSPTVEEEEIVEDEKEEGAPLNLEDWEIVSEMLDQSAQSAESDQKKMKKPPFDKSKSESSRTTPIISPSPQPNNHFTNSSSNADQVVNQLLLLLNRFVDQLSEISLIDAIFEQVLCLDYLLVFINTPADRVREIALRTYFKFYSLLYEKEHPERSRSRTATIASAEFNSNISINDMNLSFSANGSSIGKMSSGDADQQPQLKISPRTLDLLLLANQLYQYVATEETVLACLGFLLDVSRKTAVDLLNNQESRSLLRKSFSYQQSLHRSRIPLENFIPLLSVLPRCTSSPAFAHRVLQTMHRILVHLSVEQVAELQQAYGLAQALSRLLVNLNSPPEVPLKPEEEGLAEDDLNRLTREHVNGEVGSMLGEIAQRYLMRSGAFYFTSYTNLLHYYAIMERKVLGEELRAVFRDIQVGLLQSAFECLLQLQKGYKDRGAATSAARASRADGMNLLSEQFIHMLSGSDFNMPTSADLSFDYKVPTGDSTVNSEKTDRDLVKPKEALERMRFAVKQATGFVVFRDEVEPTQKEVYFQREILYHLLTIVEHIEGANILKTERLGKAAMNSKSTMINKSATVWNSLLASSKDIFKEHLTQMLLYLLSPFQTSLADRVFSLAIFTEKTGSLDHLKLFIVHKGGVDNFSAFVHLFEAFLGDLQEKGVRSLAITSLSKYAGNEHTLEDSFNSSQDSTSTTNTSTLDGVLHKFRTVMNLQGNFQSLRGKNDPSFYRTLIANWYAGIESRRSENETSIRQHVNRIFANMLPLYGQVADAASHLNEKLMLAQHREKKAYIEHLRAEANEAATVRRLLLALAAESLHEAAAWHMDAYCPKSWALSPFESRNRTRVKLERSFLEIGPRYLMANGGSKVLSGRGLFASFLGGPAARGGFNASAMPLADFATTSTSSEAHRQPPLYTSSARVILFDEEIEGEILLKSTYIQFFATPSSSQASLGPSIFARTTTTSAFSKKALFSDFLVNFGEICELNNCRYELQNIALEIYLTSGLTYLIVFEDTATRDEFVRHMTANREALPALTEPVSLVTLTQLWRERRISNFEYLTHLNKLSGRTPNDLMQYPVFPFVLADYTSEVLNLKEVSTFRIFSRPIAVQRKEREKHYVDQYNYIKAENERLISRVANGNAGKKGLGSNANHRWHSEADLSAFQFVVTAAPYHYGSHYSNSGIVLHYLVRLPPYTQMFLQYQDRNFDIADRSFHSVHTTWRLATEDSTNGFKELIPEFFYLPEFLLNAEEFNLGVRQDGERVDDVKLPPWARGSARLFTLVHRQALEANLVTRALHSWIDLVFGYQQSGRAAVDAVNVFHPATHYSADLSTIEDEVKRGAIQTMIKTFGQMPGQLFNMPHPGVSVEALLPVEDDHNFLPSTLVPEVIGIKWGEYVGSPLFGKPRPTYQRQFSMPIARLWALPTNDVVLLPANAALLVGYSQPRNPFINTLYILSYSLVTWSTKHSTIWVKSNKEEARVPFTGEAQFLDKICIVESVPYYDRLLVGYQSGLIVSFCLNSQASPNTPGSNSSSAHSFFTSSSSRQGGSTRSYALLYGHRSPVRSISLNKNYSIALSSDASGVAILWDMSKQTHIRTIIKAEAAFGSAPLTTISDTLGDLAVVSYRHASENSSLKVVASKLSVFTINGRSVGEVITGSFGGADHLESLAYITSLCYSTCTEGLAVNAIATGLSNGAIKLWSSWDLTLLRTIKLHRVNIPIRSISFSFTNDILYVILDDNLMVALENSSTTFSPPSTVSASTEAARKNFRILDLTPDHTDSIL